MLEKYLVHLKYLLLFRIIWTKWNKEDTCCLPAFWRALIYFGTLALHHQYMNSVSVVQGYSLKSFSTIIFPQFLGSFFFCSWENKVLCTIFLKENVVGEPENFEKRQMLTLGIAVCCCWLTDLQFLFRFSLGQMCISPLLLIAGSFIRLFSGEDADFNKTGTHEQPHEGVFLGEQEWGAAREGSVLWTVEACTGAWNVPQPCLG